MQQARPRLTPAIADVRRAVRAALAPLSPENEGRRATTAPPTGVRDRAGQSSPSFSEAPLVLVALSGGPDSLALAAAVAFEAPRVGLRAGAVVVDHQLQEGSAGVAARAAAQARELGLDPVEVRAVSISESKDGPEAAARKQRYKALAVAKAESGAVAVLLGHTLNDQAETVLLGLARGSGPASLHGMAAASGPFLRPMLGIHRATTVQACADAGLEPWTDPQNSDEAYSRVRVRRTVLPVLEAELGPGIADALARTAEQLREDSDALDRFADELIEEIAEIAEAGVSLPVATLEANPAALRQRLIRLAVASEFHVSLSRAQTLEVAKLVTDWHGQGPIDLPGLTARRDGGLVLFEAAG
jgi:tRNA(Ile)-lysidine synthase